MIFDNQSPIEKIAKENNIAREIVKQIENLGINERQRMLIINQLALGLENIVALQDITDVIKTHKESVFITGNIET